MMPRTLLSLAMCGLFFAMPLLTSAQNLARGSAKQLLSSFSRAHPITVTLCIAPFEGPMQAASPLPGQGAMPLGSLRQLTQSGLLAVRYIAQPEFATFEIFAFTPVGEKASATWHRGVQCTERTASYYYDVPVGTLKIDQVTGIEKVDATHIIIHFQCTLLPRGIGKWLPTDGSATVSIFGISNGSWRYPWGHRSSASDSDWTIDATLYDDGWRVIAK